jgi:hypothetical protein
MSSAHPASDAYNEMAVRMLTSHDHSVHYFAAHGDGVFQDFVSSHSALSIKIFRCNPIQTFVWVYEMTMGEVHFCPSLSTVAWSAGYHWLHFIQVVYC